MNKLISIGKPDSNIFQGFFNLEIILGYLHANNESYSKLFILVDENTEELCLPNFVGDYNSYTLLRMEEGESHKTLDTVSRIWQQLIDCEADRNSLLINLGGGVVCDLGGFVASCYKRGIRYINVPTTLLAQVDASVGAKTGIDFGEIKNSIGTFYEPRAVFLSDSFFRTLPFSDWIAGYAEILKHAVLQGKPDFHNALHSLKLKVANNELIAEQVKFKLSIVQVDPFEKAQRKFLNFGHTFAHAFESYFLYNCSDVLHGHAVAHGMYCEMYLSHLLLGFPIDEVGNFRNVLIQFYPQLPFRDDADEAVLHFMKNDKKNSNQEILFTLLEDYGQPKINCIVSEEQIMETLDYYFEHTLNYE